MSKIRILIQLNSLGYGGTEKAVLSFCRLLDRARFEPYLFFYTDKGQARYWKKWLLRLVSAKQARSFTERYRTYYSRLGEFEKVLGKDHVVLGTTDAFVAAVERIGPAIIHFNRGDEWDFYTEAIERVPAGIALLETNIFGKPARAAYLDRLSRISFISRWLMDKSAWHGGKGVVLYNPIREPASDKSLREELGIPASARVLGRISRPNLDDGSFIYDIYKALEQPDLYLLVLGAAEALKAAAAGHPRIKLLEPTTDEARLSGFYNSLDLLLHYRREGETMGMNIAEAMMHGKPVVSHLSSVDNAQAELLSGEDFGPVGMVVAENDRQAYLAAARHLLEDAGLREQMGENARRKAMALYREAAIVQKLEAMYEELAGLRNRT